jgi:hypothetical protein
VNNTIYATCENGVVSIKDQAITTLATPVQCTDPRGLFVGKNGNIIYATCGIYDDKDGSIVSILPLAPPSPSPGPGGGLSGTELLGVILGSIGGFVLLFFVICCIILRNKNENPEKIKLISS